MMKRRLSWEWLVGIALVFMFLFFGPTDNWRWDPSFYYAQLRSPIIDRDLDFRGETQTGQVELKPTVTGLQGSVWPIGPSIAWTPFFLIAHFGTQLWPALPSDGYSVLYIAFVSLGTVTYSVFGVVLCAQIGQWYTNASRAWLFSLSCLLATPLFFYTFRQPLMAHAMGFCVVAGLVLVYLYMRQQSTLVRESGLLFGVLLGLCFLMRWNGVLLFIIPASYFLEHAWRAWQQRSWSMLSAVSRQMGIASVAFLLTISPQLALWQQLYGSWLRIPQGANTFTGTLFPIHIGNILFSTSRGLLFWLPLALVGLIGLFFISDRTVRWTFIITIALQLMLFGYRKDWYGGGGFGSRYFVDLLPIIVVGLAAFFQRWPSGISIGFAAFCVLHQLILIFAVEHGVEGWVDLERLGKGLPLGIDWQVRAFLHLLQHPLDWFLPRPFVGIDRQTLITALLHGLPVSPIVMAAVCATPLIAVAGWIVYQRRSTLSPVWLSSLLMIGLCAYALYLLSL